LYVALAEVPLVAVGLGFSVGVAAAPEADASRIKPADAELAVGLAGAPGAVLLGDEVSAFRQPVTVIVGAALLLFVSC
jgi:hypothetical protein